MGLFNKGNTVESTLKVNYDGKKAEKGLKKLENTIKSVITIEAIRRMLIYTKNLALLGAQVESVENNFENFAKSAGRSVDDMMKSLRKATLGMVNDLELQQRAMQAMVSGVEFGDIITAMEFVTKFATATGTDVSAKMMTTMTGLARGSAQFLDDIGIQVIGSKDVVNDAIAQMKEKMDQFTLSEEDASVKADNLKAKWDNLRATAGKALTPALSRALDIMIRLTKEADILINKDSEYLEDVIGKTGKVEFAQILFNKALELENKTRAEIEKTVNKIAKDKVLALKVGFQEKDLEFILEGQMKKREKLHERLNGLVKDRIALQKNLRKELGFKDEGEEEGTNVDRLNKVFKDQEKRNQKAIDDAAKKKTKKKKNDFLTSEELISNSLSAFMKKDRKRVEEFEEDQRQEKINRDKENQERELDDLRVFTEQKKDALETLGNIGLSQTEINLRSQLDLINKWRQEGVVSVIEHQQLLTEIERQQSEERVKNTIKEQQEKNKAVKQGLSAASTINNAIIDIIDVRTQKEIEALDKRGLSEEEYAKRKEQILKKSEEDARAFAVAQQAIAVGEAWVNVGNAALDVFANEGGGVVTKGLAMAAAIAIGAAETAKLAAITFQNGEVGIGGIQNSRQRDDTFAMIGQGESVIPAPQTAAHEEELRAISNNTANTARGIQAMGKQNITNVFNGVSTEQMLSAMITIKRRKLDGRRL